MSSMSKKNSERLQCLKNKFLKISAAKLKECIFIGPQIRELIKDSDFVHQLSKQELWKTFIRICENLLGNNKASTYKEWSSKSIKYI
jgi:hypothetical protein